jgi:hypothetical protein
MASVFCFISEDSNKFGNNIINQLINDQLNDRLKLKKLETLFENVK